MLKMQQMLPNLGRPLLYVVSHDSESKKNAGPVDIKNSLYKKRPKDNLCKDLKITIVIKKYIGLKVLKCITKDVLAIIFSALSHIIRLSR